MDEIEINLKGRSIILFDGVCNLCNGSVQFVLTRDKNRHFLYATLQGEQAEKLLKKHGKNNKDLDSFLLIENGQLYQKSTAALRVAKKLNAAWPLLYFFIIIPQPLRDTVYNFIAKNRYKWFGKRESCMLPTKETKALFLD